MGRVVQACYRPKGEEHVAALEALVREHVPVLRAEGLVTDRAPIVVRSTDGTIIEIFEWVDDAAVEAAHTNPAVRVLWERFDAVSEHVTLAALPEARAPFATFDPLEG